MFSPQAPKTPNIALITIICGSVVLAVALIAMALFVWVRWFVRRQFRGEDYLSLPAFAITAALVVHTTWVIKYEGLGRHERDVSLGHRAAIIKVISTPVAAHLHDSDDPRRF